MKWFLLAAVLIVSCKGGKIAEDDCQSICGSDARLTLAVHECARIGNAETIETCILAATVAFNTCHSRCE